MPYGPKRLTPEQASEIRRLYGLGMHTQKQLGELFKVSQPMICKIVNNEAHKPELLFGGQADVRVGFKYAN
jgi:predicted transcriptional regulator